MLPRQLVSVSPDRESDPSGVQVVWIHRQLLFVEVGEKRDRELYRKMLPKKRVQKSQDKVFLMDQST